MQKLNCLHHAGRWRAEFERVDKISVTKTPSAEEDIGAIYRYFNEIGILAQLSQNLFESVMPEGLTLSQFSVLSHFVRLQRIESPARLAKAFQVTKGAMTNTLARLKKQGFVTIAPDPDDGRAKLVDITMEGKQAYRDCITALSPKLAMLKTDLGVKGFSRALPQLEKVRIYLDEARG